MTLFLTETLAEDPGLAEAGGSTALWRNRRTSNSNASLSLSEAVLTATPCRFSRCKQLESD